MSILKGILSLLVIILVAISVMFVDFAYKTFSLKQRDVKADAIVVLTGGRGRVEEGLRLYGEGRGRLLLFIGVDPSVKKGELLKGAHDREKAEGVVLEQMSRNTLENAFYARDLIVKKKVGSIILITSRYHMKRAALLFRNLLPKYIAIYYHPVDTKNLQHRWWNDNDSFRLLFAEFYKYCTFRFFFLFASGELRP
jgi:uncharacterized SAM-binding protein YcdF (DUF218 family)